MKDRDINITKEVLNGETAQSQANLHGISRTRVVGIVHETCASVNYPKWQEITQGGAYQSFKRLRVNKEEFLSRIN